MVGPRRRPRRRPPHPHRRQRPRAAVGPDLNQLFVGSRGHARRHHRRPPAAAPRARATSAGPPTASPSFDDGLDAMRRILQRGATPAVLRLYDAAEADRTYETGDRRTAARARRGRPGARRRHHGARRRGVPRRAEPRRRRALVEHWLEHRNDVAALEALISRGYVVDTMEVAGPLGATCRPSTPRPSTRSRRSTGTHRGRRPTSRTRYTDGACLYFTFAGQGRARRARRATTGRRGTPARGPSWPTAARSATTTASGSTAAASCAEALGPALRRARGRRRPRSTRTASSTRASSGSPSPFGARRTGEPADG